MDVIAYKCLTCGDVIYSRAPWDKRMCYCGRVAVEGGLNEQFMTCTPLAKVQTLDIEVWATTKELFDDWDKVRNKFGLIKD